jgi:rfaE bifunctional protein nucleotidyltransferase chain/domain
MSAIITFSDIGDFVQQQRKDHPAAKIVFTNGVFDIIHRGHVQYLEQARLHGDLLIVGLNSDASVRRLKGELRPFNNQEDRAYVLSRLKPVDHVCIFDQDTPLELIKAVKPNVLIKGGDYTIDQIVGREYVEKSGGSVHTIPLIKGRSTTNLLEKIKGESNTK